MSIANNHYPGRDTIGNDLMETSKIQFLQSLPCKAFILVWHENWCDKITGQGECNCNPETNILVRNFLDGRDN